MRAGVAPRPLVRGPALTRAALVLGGGIVLLLAALVLGIGLGSVTIAPDDVLRVLVHRLFGVGATSGVSESLETIVIDLRLPRVLGAMVVGAGLACAGTVFQAVLRNPMADPYIIGTAAGASLGATIGIVAPLLVPALALGAGSAWLGLGLVQLLAFAGGIGTVLVVIAVARSGGRLPVGHAAADGLRGVVAPGGRRRDAHVRLRPRAGRHLLVADGLARRGRLGRSRHRRARGARRLRPPLRSLAEPQPAAARRRAGRSPGPRRRAREAAPDHARHPGNLGRSSPSPAPSASSGWWCRTCFALSSGPDHRLLLPASALLGAALLVVADLGARLAGGIPVGVVTAFLGAPFFLWLLRRSRRVSASMSA